MCENFGNSGGEGGYILGARGSYGKSLPWGGGVWIFSGTTQSWSYLHNKNRGLLWCKDLWHFSLFYSYFFQFQFFGRSCLFFVLHHGWESHVLTPEAGVLAPPPPQTPDPSTPREAPKMWNTEMQTCLFPFCSEFMQSAFDNGNYFWKQKIVTGLHGLP